MAATIKNLYNGQLPNSKTTLYTATGVTAVVLNAVVVNTDVVARTFNLYYKKAAGTSRRITAKDQSLDPGFKATMEEKITLGAGDMIEGDASVAAVVDCTISGVERS